MKPLKVTLLATFSIVLLTGVSQFNDGTKPSNNDPNVKKVESVATVLHKKKGIKLPSQS